MVAMGTTSWDIVCAQVSISALSMKIFFFFNFWLKALLAVMYVKKMSSLIGMIFVILVSFSYSTVKKSHSVHLLTWCILICLRHCI